MRGDGYEREHGGLDRALVPGGSTVVLLRVEGSRPIDKEVDLGLLAIRASGWSALALVLGVLLLPSVVWLLDAGDRLGAAIIPSVALSVGLSLSTFAALRDHRENKRIRLRLLADEENDLPYR